MSQPTAPVVAKRYDGIAIRSVFKPNRGWRRLPIRRRVSRPELIRLRNEGVTHVQLVYNGRTADFTIGELLGGKVGAR